MIDCRKVAQQLLEFLDRECDGKTARAIEEHLELCRPCFDVKEFERILRDHMRAKTNRCCPDKVRRKIQGLLDRF